MTPFPEYPTSIEILEIDNHTWTEDDETFSNCSLEQQLAVWIHFSYPIRYNLWRSLDLDGKFALSRFGGPFFASTLFHMWRGRLSSRWSQKVRDDRDEFITACEIEDLVSIYHRLNPTEIHLVFSDKNPTDAASLFEEITENDRRYLWKHFADKQREMIWSKLDEEEQAELVETLSRHRGILHSVALPLEDGGVIGNKMTAFLKAYDESNHLYPFITLSAMGEILGVDKRTVRRHAKNFGFFVINDCVYNAEDYEKRMKSRSQKPDLEPQEPATDHPEPPEPAETLYGPPPENFNNPARGPRVPVKERPLVERAGRSWGITEVTFDAAVLSFGGPPVTLDKLSPALHVPAGVCKRYALAYGYVVHGSIVSVPGQE